VLGLTDSLGNSVTYDVYSTLSTKGAVTVNIGGTNVTDTGTYAIGTFSDKDLNFVTGSTAAAGDNAQVTFYLRKKNTTNGSVLDNNVASVVKKATVIDPANETLTYSVNSVKDLFAAINDGTLSGAANGEDVLNSGGPAYGAQRHEVTISAKDAAGNAVAFAKHVTSVTSDTYSVAVAQADAPAADGTSTGWVIGNNAGKANLTVIFKDAKGNYQSLTTAVNVKADLPYVSSIAADNAGSSVSVASTINGKYAYDILGNVDIYDQYGTEYKNAGTVSSPATTNIIYNFDKYLGVRYYVSDLVWSGTAGTVSVSNDGLISVSGGTLKSATITAVAPTGKSVSTYVAITTP
jgi:hypothetical protein